MSPPGATVYRVSWTPGSDLLLATCHCGAQCELEDPIAAWDWLRDHPVGHAAADPSLAARVDEPVGASPQ